MRNPSAYGVPVYGAPSPREEVTMERKPCSKHRPLCLDCGLLDDDPLSDEIVAAVRAYQKAFKLVQNEIERVSKDAEADHHDLNRLRTLKTYELKELLGLIENDQKEIK